MSALSMHMLKKQLNYSLHIVALVENYYQNQLIFPKHHKHNTCYYTCIILSCYIDAVSNSTAYCLYKLFHYSIEIL